jgi:hypothetical protein
VRWRAPVVTDIAARSRTAPAAPVAPPTGDTPAPTTPGPTTPPPLARLGVTATEFALTLSRTELAAGEALIELANFGEDPHNMWIVPLGGGTPKAAFPLTDPGARSRERVTLAPGSYRLYCTLLDHEALGMSAVLVVR